MKEVVHVPTLELAEKVSKVAKEQGFKGPSNELEYYFKRKSNKLCFRFEEDGFSFAAKDIFEELGYKVITAEDFLSRYEPKFKPIAMKCSREQFEAVRPKLEKLGDIGDLKGAFYRCNYLTNNYSIKDSLVFDFIGVSAIFENTHRNNIHHDWDEPVFLQHCGYIDEGSTELEQLRKENAELKEQLKAIENQPKVGDVCLFWDDESDYAALMYYDKESVSMYDNCQKATPENIEKVMEIIKLNNK